MRFFNKLQDVKTSHLSFEKAKKFAVAVINTVDYRDSSQSNKNKVALDHFISKIGEEAVFSVFSQFTTDITPPDYKIYEARRKSWDPDLMVEQEALAVKTQTKSSAEKFGLSWTFQCGGRRRDTILDMPEAWVCFVKCNDEDGSYNCIVYPPHQIKELTFGQPKLQKLRGEKLVVYAKNNGLA